MPVFLNSYKQNRKILVNSASKLTTTIFCDMFLQLYFKHGFLVRDNLVRFHFFKQFIQENIENLQSKKN